MVGLNKKITEVLGLDYFSEHKVQYQRVAGKICNIFCSEKC